MSLAGCSSGNSSLSAGDGSEEIRFHKKRGASFNDWRGRGRGVRRRFTFLSLGFTSAISCDLSLPAFHASLSLRARWRRS